MWRCVEKSISADFDRPLTTKLNVIYHRNVAYNIFSILKRYFYCSRHLIARANAWRTIENRIAYSMKLCWNGNLRMNSFRLLSTIAKKNSSKWKDFPWMCTMAHQASSRIPNRLSAQPLCRFNICNGFRILVLQFIRKRPSSKYKKNNNNTQLISFSTSLYVRN